MVETRDSEPPFSLKIRFGDWLYRHCFPLYDFAYGRFKKRQDRQELELLGKRIKPGDRVLDIGSNIGFYARVLSSLVGPEGRVYCFEPDTINYRHLVRTTASRSNITRFNLAVSDRKGNARVYRSKQLNVDTRTFPVEGFDSGEEVGACSMDALIADKTIDRVDFIKIDIQGSELLAFKGMSDLLSSSGRLEILAEYWPHGMRQAGVSPPEFHDFFDRMQYRFRLLDRGTLKAVGREFFVDNADKPWGYYSNLLIARNAGSD